MYTAETDPNALLDRPFQYTGKLNFRDARIQSILDDFNTSNGGTIEVFGTTEDAQGRYDYVPSLIQGNPILTEYLYLEGTVLVRVSSTLTPDQAAPYGEVVKALVGCST